MLDLDAALDHLSTRPLRSIPLVEGLPSHELSRSPAAHAVGMHAQDSGLFLAHFEHRVALGGNESTEWHQGVLPEGKYDAFWHEVPIGSFHPHHRAKWGAHELCHGLVGSAWWPGASSLALATAGRLAELVPVVLWYFLDEIGLKRCPRHREPLFRSFCSDCEAAAMRGVRQIDPAAAEDWLRQANRFLDRELAAVARTRALGRPVHHVWGSLDLASDGLAYASHHAERLAGAAFHRWAERFYRPEWGGHGSLDDLEARAVAVVRSIAEGTPLAPWAEQPEVGWARWVSMDVAARLSLAAEGLSDVAPLIRWMDALADGASIRDVFEEYREEGPGLSMPPADEVFAVGYAVEGVPSRSVAQVGDGLGSVVPLTLTLFEDAELDPIPAFVADDPAERRPLGERFAGVARPGPAGRSSGACQV